MATGIEMQMKTPPDKDGIRHDIHPITRSEAVLVHTDTEDPVNETTLDVHLKKMESRGIEIQASKPDHACIWAQPVDI